MSDIAGETLRVPVLSATRTEVGSVDVPAAVLGGPVREHLLHEMVKSQRASQRSGTHATKTRGLVSGGGKKPWRQKGTGRARAGSSRSPIWVGGGTIFGPQPRSYAYRLPRGARRAALRSALAARHASGGLLVVEAITLSEPKTKRMAEFLSGLGVTGSTLVVLAEPNEVVERAARNLPLVKVLPVAGLNVYDVLRHTTLVMPKDALDAVSARLSRGGAV
jgi:large subunit ribosomal protein L4